MKIKTVTTALSRSCAAIATAVLVFGMHKASAQSIGCNIVTGGAGGIDDTRPNSMLQADLAGVPSLGLQTNWNNLSGSGSGTFVLTNSSGTTYSFDMQWDSGFTDTTGTGAGLGTPDGKLMDGFMASWGPGDASALGNSVINSAINNKPLVYIKGLNNWYTAEGAEGYKVVLYTTGNSYYETAEGWIQSVSGSPLNNTMVEGGDLSTHLWEVDTSVYVGSYIPTTGTNDSTKTFGANYMVFDGLTNDAILIRLQSHGYGSGMNAFQFVPIFPTLPSSNAPTFSPSSTVYAFVPVTVTETATGDPFHPQLWYQWYDDGATGGPVTHLLTDATNATYNLVPTNNTSAYSIQYVCVVSNIFGVSTSTPAILTVNPAVAPYVTQDTTPGPGSSQATVYAYAGGSISFSAAFGGTPPTYLWQSNSVDIASATNSTLTLTNLPLSASANYRLTATNSIDGVASTPASLVVLADPAAPDASVAYAHDVFTNNPVAYWRFSETLDNVGNFIQAYDYSGNSHNATYGVGVAGNQPGPQSPQFVGFETTNIGVFLMNNVNGSSLTVPSLNLNTNAVTISAWINPSANPSANWGLFMWRGNNGDGAGLGFGGNSSNGVAELGYTWNTNSPSSYNFHSALFPPVGQWSFVTLAIGPTNTTIYLYYIDVNTGTTNLLRASQFITNNIETFNGGTTWIGSDSSANRTFNGGIDEVAVFNKTLSETQVQDLFLKALGTTCVTPLVSDATIYPAASVYSGQNVRLTSTVSGTSPLFLRWQSSPDGTTWTDMPGQTAPSLLANPQVVGTVYYHLIAANGCASVTNNAAAVTFNALPVTPPGLWTINYQVTNNVLNYSTGAGVGHYNGRGILGNGTNWNVLPDNAGAFGYVGQLTSVSDLLDDGGTHSGIYCSVTGGSSGFGSATAVQPDSSDIGNLLYQWVTSYSTNNSLQFYGVPDGTYNLCFYGCDGSFGDRGTTFRVHGANGDQTAATINASPILPLQQGVNFVVISNVHVVGGTLNVDILPTTPVPSHDPNGEADFNGVQLQLVSYDAPQPTVTLNAGVSGSNMTLSWPQGILETATNLQGTWTPIYTPSPATIPIGTTNSTQLYRVKVK
jgi:hypothetical protein